MPRPRRVLHNESDARDYIHRHVSRETWERLEHYAALLLKWQPRINLIAPASLPHLWQRHMADSVQLALRLAPDAFPLADIGSGGGFPGLVIACCFPDAPVTLVESDSRKCAFLREAGRVLSLPHLTVVTGRVEQLAPLQAGTYTMRGFAELARILELLRPHLSPRLTLLLLKGEQHREEITNAERHWLFTVETGPSITHPKGCIMRLTDITER